MISDAIIRTICSWLPTLDEARLREVEDFVLAKAIEQQDSAPADTVVPHDGERTHGGNLSWQPGNCPACYATIGVDPDGTIADHDHPDRGWAEIGCPGSGHPPLTEPEKRAVVEHYDRIESGLRELRDAPPDLNSAEMWRPEVDGRFDDGGES